MTPTSRKLATGPGTARGSISRYSEAAQLAAVDRAEALIREGLTVRQASREAADNIHASAQTVQRWAVKYDRPLGRLIQESARMRTAPATAAQRAYTGADYRRAASRIMRMTVEGIEEIEERRRQRTSHGAEGIAMASKVSLMLSRAVQLEKKLIELGFGLEPGDQGGTEESSNTVIDWEKEVAEVRRFRAEQQAATEEN